MLPDSTRPPTPPENAATAECRALARAEALRPLPRRIHLVETLEPLDAWIVNLSQGGIALLLTRPLPAGAVLFIELESVPDMDPVRVWADVVRCAAADHASWLVGCEFVTCLSAHDLEATLR